MPADGTDDNTEDADLQAALKMSLGDEFKNSTSADHDNVESDMLAEAMRLSLQDASLEMPSIPDTSAEKHSLQEEVPLERTGKADGLDAPVSNSVRDISFGSFVLGRDYPFPILEPVSLRGTETVAAQARAAQQQRDAHIRQNEAWSRARNGGKAVSASVDVQKKRQNNYPAAAVATHGEAAGPAAAEAGDSPKDSRGYPDGPSRTHVEGKPVRSMDPREPRESGRNCEGEANKATDTSVKRNRWSRIR